MEDDNFEAQLKLLTKCPADKLTKLIHSVCDRLCGRVGVSYSEEFESIWTLDEWFAALGAISLVLKNIVNEHDHIKGLGEVLSPDYLKVFRDVAVSRTEELVEALKLERCKSGSEFFLKDFDWDLKLSLGSSSLSNMREPIASFNFQLQSSNSNKQLLLEMNKKELAQFIQTLENADKAIGQLQV